MLQHAVVACARGYIGTPFHHQGRLKATGIDCLGLLVEVARELSLVSRTGELLASCDELSYSHQPDTKKLIQLLSAHLYPIPVHDMTAGDIALMQVDSAPQHMGIVTDFGGGAGIIHAYAPARKVVEHALDSYWSNKISLAFRLVAS